MAEEEQEIIKVKDRRRFLSEAEEASQKGPSAGPEETRERPREVGQPSATAPAVNFPGFILGLGTQALMCLGEIASPEDGKPHPDLEAARQLIDVLGMLKDKTRGNLQKDEEQLLDHLLYDLRMRYVKSVGKDPQEAKTS